MAPLATLSQLEKRAIYCNGYYYYNRYSCYSPWNSWGRWVLLAGILVGVFLVYLMFACISARRRRRAGRNPYPLTGWASRPQANSQWANQNTQAQYGQQGGYNQGYNQGGYTAPPAYGGQQSYGVQQPQPVYGADRDIGVGHYAPPSGPPPGQKGDNVVR